MIFVRDESNKIPTNYMLTFSSRQEIAFRLIHWVFIIVLFGVMKLLKLQKENIELLKEIKIIKSQIKNILTYEKDIVNNKIHIRDIFIKLFCNDVI